MALLENQSLLNSRSMMKMDYSKEPVLMRLSKLLRVMNLLFMEFLKKVPLNLKRPINITPH
jgi:hypothetical protein